MSPSLYLDMLDEMLGAGVRGLSKAFVDAQVDFVTGCQQPDGGFRGRQGGSDLYYTDFALRSLALFAAAGTAFDRAAHYLARRSHPLRGIVECFSLLSAWRLLEGRVTAVAKDFSAPPRDELSILKEHVYKHRLPRGGFARFDGDGRVSAYATFLGALCCQMLGEDLPALKDAVDVVAALKRCDGGYAELEGQPVSQTSATAAAVAFLMMQDALVPEKTAETAQFIARMQAADGGLKPHAAAGSSDLLSTFTGLLTLAALDGLQTIDTAGVAKFLRSSSHPCGGFLACAGDDSPDVEYTYYGAGILALLRVSE